MNKKLKAFRLAWLMLFLALTVFFFVPSTVQADTAAPNITAINETYVCRNVLQTGDMFAIARYTVSYTSNPVTDISQTFTFRFMDTTNTIELASTAAYPYQNAGYGMGVVGWYFPPATAPAWGQPYWIKIQGVVTAFTTPPVTNYQIPAQSYSALTSQKDEQTELGTKIIKWAVQMGNSWNPVIVLTQSIETGTLILTQAGSDYFNNSLPGIHAMAPYIFLIGVGDPTAYTPESWNTNQSTTYMNRLKGSEYGDGIQSAADLFNINYNMIAMIPIILACLVLIVVGAKDGNVLSGFMNSACVITAGAWVGLFPTMPMSLIAFACAGYIIFHLAWKGS